MNHSTETLSWSPGWAPGDPVPPPVRRKRARQRPPSTKIDWYEVIRSRGVVTLDELAVAYGIRPLDIRRRLRYHERLGRVVVDGDVVRWAA